MVTAALLILISGPAIVVGAAMYYERDMRRARFRSRLAYICAKERGDCWADYTAY